MYAIIKDQKFTGVTYSELNDHITSHHLSQGDSWLWVDTPPEEEQDVTFDQFKQAKLAELASARWQEMSAPTTVEGYTALWYADKESMNDMHRASLDLAEAISQGILPDTTTLLWKTADGTFTELTLTDLVTVRLLLSQRQQALYTQEATLQAQIAAAETLEGLEAITWPVG